VQPRAGATSARVSDSKTLAAGDAAGKVVLWDVASERKLGGILAGSHGDGAELESVVFAGCRGHGSPARPARDLPAVPAPV